MTQRLTRNRIFIALTCAMIVLACLSAVALRGMMRAKGHGRRATGLVRVLSTSVVTASESARARLVSAAGSQPAGWTSSGWQALIVAAALLSLPTNRGLHLTPLRV